MNRTRIAGAAMCLAYASFAQTSTADMFTETFVFSGANGHAATVTFNYDTNSPLELKIAVKEQSVFTGAYASGLSTADMLLTTISWDFGHPGYNGDAQITGGSVKTIGNSQSVNFSIMNVGNNADVSGEYGYGNEDGTMALTNFFSASVSGTQNAGGVFGTVNLDGPSIIDGPQAGLISDSNLGIFGSSLGGINDQILATLTLSQSFSNLNFLNQNGVRIEYGSDHTIMTIPAPGAALLGVIGLAFVVLKRRRVA